MPVSDKIAVQVDGRELTLTNLSKVLYQVDGFTKAEVLDYYQRISAVLLPHVAGRPMTLKRYPDGVDGQSFFAKHAAAGRPDWVRTEEIVSHSSRSRVPGEPIEYVVIDDLPTLMWAANLAAAKQYREREGHLNVPRKHLENVDGTEYKLGYWIANARAKKANLTAERAAQLTELGMRWA